MWVDTIHVLESTTGADLGIGRTITGGQGFWLEWRVENQFGGLGLGSGTGWAVVLSSSK